MNIGQIVIKRGNSDENKLIFAFCYFIAFFTIDYLVNLIMNIQFWDSLITKGILYISFILALRVVLRRFKPVMLIIPGILVLLWMISYLLFPGNRPYLTETIPQYMLMQIIPIVLIIYAIRDWESLYKSLRMTSIIVIICAVLYILIFTRDTTEINHMQFSYNIMFSVTYMIFLSFQQKSILNIIYAFCGILCLLILGTRGALVGIGIGIIIYMVTSFKPNTKNIVGILTLSIIVMMLWVEYSNILIFVKGLFDSWGVSSRTIEYLIQNEFFNSSGRDMFWKASLSIIKDNPIIGAGMAGDRYMLNEYIGYDSYTHNIITELLVQYGVFLGGIMLFLLVRYIMKSIFSSNKDGLYYICLISICSNGFIKLLFSSSYLLEPMFFIMLVLCQKVILNKNNQSMNKTNILIHNIEK